MINNRDNADFLSAIEGEQDGLITIPGKVSGLGQLYTSDDEDGNLSYDNIASPLGDFEASRRYHWEQKSGLHTDANRRYRDRAISLYLDMNAAAYNGWEAEPVLYDTGESYVGRVYHAAFSIMKGFREDPGRVLALKINGEICGVFDPGAGVFLPSAEYQGKKNPVEYARANPAIAKRTCAYIRLLCGHLAAPYGEDFHTLFHDLETCFTEDELLEEETCLRAEPAAQIQEDVAAYIQKVSPSSIPGLVCGSPGENTSNILFPRPCLIPVNHNAVIPMGSAWRVVDDLWLVPPFHPEGGRPDRLECKSGTAEDGGFWAAVSVERQGTLHYRVYSIRTDDNDGSCYIVNPDYVASLQDRVPDGILQKYNYIRQGSTATVRYILAGEAEWTLLPADGCEVSDTFETFQDPDRRWRIHQRATPADCLYLSMKASQPGKADIPLGTVLLKRGVPFKAAHTTRHVAFDLGSSRSVRLMTVRGTGIFNAGNSSFPADAFIHPLTPMTPNDIAEVEEYCYDRLFDSGTYIEPLVQRFTASRNGAASVRTTGLLAGYRNWRPDHDSLFAALMKDSGSMNDARTRLGVEAAPKERLSASGLSEEDRYESRFALRYYTATLFMESICQAAADGYSFASGNLRFGVSYPDNGSDTGLAREVREAIQGAADYVNQYLSPGNRLVEGKTLLLYPENLATNVWHSQNPPLGMFLGRGVAASTSDCGNTTLDYTLAANGHTYTCSVLYAGREITIESLSEAYRDNPVGVLDCFTGVSPELAGRAQQALLAAAGSSQGRLDQRLGFSMTLGQLFNAGSFSNKSANADQNMHRLQRLISIKEYISIPAVAATIVRAVMNGDVSPEDDILIAPVGRGSLALDNTVDGFRNSYAERLKMQLQKVLGQEFSGNIRFLENNDVEKKSVAEGILYMMEGITADLSCVPLFESEQDREDHYLDLVYGTDDSDKKSKAREHLRSLDRPETCADYTDAFDSLYETAFRTLMASYTYDDFEQSFNTWAYMGRSDEGRSDRLIRDTVRNNFQNMHAEAQETMKNFIMCYPGVEKEHICGAFVDICLRKVSANI